MFIKYCIYNKDKVNKHKYYVNKGITISLRISLIYMYNFTGKTNKNMKYL